MKKELRISLDVFIEVEENHDEFKVLKELGEILENDGVRYVIFDTEENNLEQ